MSETHAKTERFSAAAEDIHKKYYSAASGENLLKLALVDHKRTITFLTQEVEKLKLSHKDTVDRLQLELSLAKGNNNTTDKGARQQQYHNRSWG